MESCNTQSITKLMPAFTGRNDTPPQTKTYKIS